MKYSVCDFMGPGAKLLVLCVALSLALGAVQIRAEVFDHDTSWPSTPARPTVADSLRSSGQRIFFPFVLKGVAIRHHRLFLPGIMQNLSDPAWVWVGPVRAETGPIAPDPHTEGTLYIVGPGLRKSADRGASWATISDGLPTHMVADIAVDPVSSGVIYGAMWGDGVQKSTNGGASWLPSHGPSYSFVNAVGIAPSDPQIVYASACQNWEICYIGFFRSMDGGDTWQDASAVLAHVIVVDWQRSSVVYVLQNGVMKSTDGGTTWYRADHGMREVLGYYADMVYALVMDPHNADTLYAGTRWGVFKTTDGANNWTSASSGLLIDSVGALAIDPKHPTTIYAGVEGQVYKSTDGGVNWHAISPNWSISKIRSIAVDPFDTRIVYAGTDDGVWRYAPPTGDFINGKERIP